VNEKRRTTSDEARRVGDAIGVDWSGFDLEQFRAGMDVEFEHGSHDPQTDVTGRWRSAELPPSSGHEHSAGRAPGVDGWQTA
jgi:hypothetical protein